MAVVNTTGAAGLKPGLPIEGLKGPQTPGNSSIGGTGSQAGADFKRALDQASLGIGGQLNGTGGIAANGISTGSIEKLKFSNHAIERMRSRGIAFAPETMKDIEGAVSKAAAKGAKDTLVLAGDNALIVSVKNNTVVTVMDRAAMKDNVFTNIDSTVVV